MRKVFIVAGELSGDKLGAWYVERLRKEDQACEIHAVGGTFLEKAGATLYERIEKLNVVGFIEILKHIRFLLRFMRELAKHIVSNNFDEVIVVDFPGFNLKLIKKLKKLNPSIKITYLSPPQLWAWGAWRLRTIRNYCDDVIVIYPFEVDWYKERNVDVRWLGYPFYEKLEMYFERAKRKENRIALIPGSRSVEIKRLLPLFAKVIKKFKLSHPTVQIVVPLAESVKKQVVEKVLRAAGIGYIGKDFIVVQGEKEKLKELSTCCLALTKPGTITLELGLLSVPAIIAYKASWLTYWFARLLVNIDSMSLPTLLLGEKVYTECLQRDCTEKKILYEVTHLYDRFAKQDKEYLAIRDKLGRLQKILK